MTMRMQYAVCFSLVCETIPKANLLGTVLSVQVAEQQSVWAFTSRDGQTCSAHVHAICCLQPTGSEACFLEPMSTVECSMEPTLVQTNCVRPMHTLICCLQLTGSEACFWEPMVAAVCQCDLCALWSGARTLMQMCGWPLLSICGREQQHCSQDACVTQDRQRASQHTASTLNV
jgi:hypothetical protein